MTKGKEKVEEIRKKLNDSKANLRCSDVIQALKKLGFDVRDGKKGGHKVFVHDALSDFQSASFNCGHGKNPEIKPAYINKIIEIIDVYQADLITANED